MPRLPEPCIALVTDRHLCLPGHSLAVAVSAACDGGIDMVQVREKDLPGGALLTLAQELRETTRDRALLIVNERVDVALACGADGVQLGEEALPVEEARRLLGGDALIGRSVHSVAGAVEAEAAGADFLIVGPIFPTPSHPESEGAGTALLEQVRRAVAVPFLAIGGVDASNIEEVARAGASGAAVVRAVIAAPDPAQAVAELRAAFARGLSPAGGASDAATITVTVNGEERQLAQSLRLPELLESLGVRARHTAVAYNGDVLRREEHPNIALKDGDVLELVRPVGGG